MSRKIDYSKIPAEFQHLPKTEQSKLIFMAEDVYKLFKKMSPELLDSFTKDLQKLGEEKAEIADFESLFEKIKKDAAEALERDRIDRKKVKEVEEKISKKPPVVKKCKCDFLPNIPAYKKVSCGETYCVRNLKK